MTDRKSIRRIHLDLHTPAEQAITQAMRTVEDAGAHPHLTRAVVLLARARNAVADFVDGVIGESDDDLPPAPFRRLADLPPREVAVTRPLLALMIAPVSSANGRAVEHNLGVAKDWYTFLRRLTADLPITIVCPWLVGILLGDDESDPAQREHTMVDSEAVAARCDLTIAVGEALTLTTGMAREDRACPGPCVDLLDLGREYEHPQWMGSARREDIRDRIREVVRAHRCFERPDVAEVSAPHKALAHVRTILEILDATGGYLTADQQAAIRAAREAVSE